MGYWICVAFISLLEVRYRITIRERNRNFLKLLERVTTRLEAAGIKYWLDWGTLLGAVRDGAIMEHDTDVDVSVTIDQAAGLRAVSDWGGLEIQFFEGTARIVPAPHPWLSTIQDLSLLEITFVDPQSPHLMPLRSVEVENRAYPAPRDPQAYLLRRYGYLGKACVHLGRNRYRACDSWLDYVGYLWNRLVFYRAYFLWKGTPMPAWLRKLAEGISGATYPRLISTPKT